MNRNDRELGSDWEESWERTGRGEGKGITPAQIVLVVVAVLLIAALAAMGVIFFTR
ncbi:MAG: hypothetical protein LUI07_05970 [Lachnospiraceae bacterium]|nr:hypothetical protein [Lachnospiraceae bacterium]